MCTVSLKKECPGPAELLAQAVALISPTMTAALIMLLPYRKPTTPALIRADLDLAHTRNANI